MRTNELTGAALDWAVAKCEGFKRTAHWQPRFCTDWAQGGSIIEREHICLMYYPTHWSALAETGQRHSRGTTPLEAAMRCYVASKLGDEIEIPEGI